MSFLQVDIAAFKARWTALLEEYPELSEDGQLRADVLEGETDAHRIASKLVRIAKEREALANGIGAYINELHDRKRRELQGADGARTLLKSLMDAAGVDRLTLPEATVSITKPRVVVETTDLDAIPQGYAKFEKRADKAALKTALEAGEDVPGAALGLSDDGLMVRTK